MARINKDKENNLDHSRLTELLKYDPDSGIFIWRVHRCGRTVAGSVAGTLNPNGYRYIFVDKVGFLAHRLAWFYQHGTWPEALLDHRDRDRSNNRMQNLRECPTDSDNLENKKMYINNSTGVTGVYMYKTNGPKPYYALISCNGVQHRLGSFTSKEEAARARANAEDVFHPFKSGCKEN